MAAQVVAMTEWVPTISLGDRLRVVRRRKHRSQEEMAGLLGIKKVTYASWEAGTATPAYSVVLAVARELQNLDGVPLWWTLGAEEPRPSGPGGDVAEVRHQGLEPRTRWFGGSSDREYEFNGNEVHDPRAQRRLAPVAQASPIRPDFAQQWADHDVAAAA